MSLKLSKLTLIFSLSAISIGSPSLTQAETLEDQRKQFLKAKEHLRAGKVTSFKTMAFNLKDYALYPYLLYDYLRPRLWKLKDEEITFFLKRYGDLPMANDIRSSWLKVLAKRGRWQTFMDNYTPQAQTVLQCYQLRARIETGQQAYLLEDTRTLWLSGESQPPECDPAFARLYKSDLMTSKLIWERIHLTMEKGNTSLAKYLSRRLDSQDQKNVRSWIAMHNNPARSTKNPKYKDTELARTILLHGIKRLAKRNVDTAISRWGKLKTAYVFSEAQRSAIERDLAVYATLDKHKRARELLDGLANEQVDSSIFHWRIVAALNERDWDLLLKWTEGKPPEEDLRSRWLYWRARALEANNDQLAANEYFKTLANERDYYGFMAADRIGQAYKMSYLPLPADLETWQKLSELPAMVRARELYYLGLAYPARREWHHALNDMTSYQMQIAAAIAANWGWHDRAILALGKAKAFDDLALRFPMPYESMLSTYSKKRSLNLSWMLALTRAESIFMEDARSPAGALGLMQVMPATGRETAKEIGFRRFNTAYLLDAKKNITIGSAYLRKMSDWFHGSMILATAAYNAGPHNVMKWLPKTGCMEPDIWIEKIPFSETRKYVQRILYFASIYDWRRKQEVVKLQERMATVHPVKELQLAGLTCSSPQLSLN